MEISPLDGVGQYSLLIIALACVTYIRSVPYKHLVEKIDALSKKVQITMDHESSLGSIQKKQR